MEIHSFVNERMVDREVNDVSLVCTKTVFFRQGREEEDFCGCSPGV